MAENSGGVNVQLRHENIVRKTVPCSIKCALRKALVEKEDDIWEEGKNVRKEKILAMFRDLSIKATRIARLASLLIHVVFNSKVYHNDFQFFDVADDSRPKNSPPEQIIKQYFFGVLGKYINNENGAVVEDYLQLDDAMKSVAFGSMMNEFNILAPDNAIMNNIFKQLYQRYTVNFKNNIVMHAKSRIKKFLRYHMYILRPVPENLTKPEKKRFKKVNDTFIYHTTQYLFEQTRPRKYYQPLLDRFYDILNLNAFPHVNNMYAMFMYIDRDWFRFIPLFIKLQQYINDLQQNGVFYKNFVVIPQTSFERQHIHIDTTTMYRILLHLKYIPKLTGRKRIPAEYYAANPGKLWSMVLDEKIKGFEKFDHSIFTDGVALSLCCKKTIVERTDEQHLAHCNQLFQNGRIKQFCGLDPGYRLQVGGIIVDGNGRERNVRVPCGKYYRYARYNQRKKARRKIYNDLRTRMKEDYRSRLVPSNMW